jgi:hypothetical protein
MVEAIHQMRTIILACVTSYIFLSGVGFVVATPQEPLTLKRLSSDARPPKDAGLKRTIDRVRDSFVERDTGKLAECLGSGKVYVSLKSRKEEAGYYTSSQLQFIFDKMFKDLQTRSFEYSPRNIKGSDNGRAHLRSEWTFVALGSDKVVTEHLYLVLEKEKSGWRITEIRSSSR